MKRKILTVLGGTLLLVSSGSAFAFAAIPEIDGTLASQVVTVVGGVLLLCRSRR